jgi:hypothetical protein
VWRLIREVNWNETGQPVSLTESESSGGFAASADVIALVIHEQRMG